MSVEGVEVSGLGKELTMEPDYHFLGRRVTEPVCFRAVWKGDVFGDEAALFGECWIRYIEVRADVPVPRYSANCPPSVY